jgi:mono/diheme cytochrome c family protein
LDLSFYTHTKDIGMNHFSNAMLGLLFVGVGAGASFLMYYLWGFPFDHATHKSEAPRPLMMLHRGLGYVYAAIFVYLMIQMVPRLWNYQIELPARTVAHLIVGLVIGITLLIKIVIVRFFKHLESTLAPFLGTLLLICTIVLIGLSVPTALREALASRQETFLPANLDRVRTQFELAGLQAGKALSADDLRAGRRVLSTRCVGCHDLRTVLARPRTASDWRSTVQRMADRSASFDPIGDKEQIQVIGYLVSISPGLQGAVKDRLQQERSTETARTASKTLRAAPIPSGGFDLQRARRLFEEKCSQCHAAKMPDASTTADDVRELVMRMVTNGLSASDSELKLIIGYIVHTTVDASKK